MKILRNLLLLLLCLGVVESIPAPVQAQFVTPTIIMLAPAANRSFGTDSGNIYRSSNIGLIVNVVAGDVTSLQSQGCVLLTPRNNVSATRAPLGTDDFTAGFGIGSQWVAIMGGTPTLYVITGMTTTPGSATWTQMAAANIDGTVLPGTANQLAYYPGAGALIQGLTTANNGFLMTSPSGVPSVTNTTQGNLFLGGGKPWCDVIATGAIGDGSTDDTLAIQSCIDKIEALFGGIVFLPPAPGGVYCIKSGTLAVTSNFGVTILGSSVTSSVLGACGYDSGVGVLVLNGRFSQGINFGVFGKGSNNDHTTFGANHPGIQLAGNCISCKLSHIQIRGGNPPLSVNTVDSIIEDVDSGKGYGTANVYTNGSNWYIRDKFDDVWPVSEPGAPLSISAWAAGNAYGTGAVVSLTGYLLQATSGGTSGGSAPTLMNYEIDMCDPIATAGPPCTVSPGGVKWQLVRPIPYYALQIDTGALENRLLQVDMTGVFHCSLALTGSHSGIVRIEEGVEAGALQADICAESGNSLSVHNTDFGECLETGCSALFADSTWGGEIRMQGNYVSNTDFGINATSGTYAIVTGNYMNGILTSGVSVPGGHLINNSNNINGVLN